MTLRSTLSTLLKITIAAALVWLLIVRIDWHSVLEHLKNMTPWLLVPYVVVILGGNLLSAYRWRFLAAAHDLHASQRKFFGWYITATFINNFLPGFLGGDAYRSYMLGKTGPDKLVPAAFSVVVDRATGLFAALLIASATGMLFFIQSPYLFIPIEKIFLVVTLVVTVFAWMCMVWRIEIVTVLARILPRRKYLHYPELTRAYDTRRLWYAITLGVLFTTAGVGIGNYLLFSAFHVTLPLIPFFFFVTLAAVVASVPISIGNIGVKEWVYVTFFAIMGVSAEIAIAVVILGRVLQALISLIGVPFYFTHQRDIRVLQQESSVS
jgi:uncharacterized protein (TIRG00374 family)